MQAITFKDKCNLLAKEGNVAELERLGKAKKAKAEKYYKLGEEDYCSEDLDKSQGGCDQTQIAHNSNNSQGQKQEKAATKWDQMFLNKRQKIKMKGSTV